jgi:Protein of unknown function (DUF2478)
MEHESQFDPRRLAAVVYDEGVAVDLLLEVFARSLLERGVRVGGVLHVPRGAAGCGPDHPVQLHDLRTGVTAPLCRSSAAHGPPRCAIDPAALPAAARSIRTSLEEHAQIVFVSRFGKQEVRGSGFYEELQRGALSACVVLTAVRRGLVEDWFAFTGGVGTLLDARLWVLNDWWSELAPAA